MKTVGNYEAELKKLSEENFELKHQVAYLKANQGTGQIDENIQKLLYDSKQSIDILENENKNLSRQVENMKEVIRSSSLDRENLKEKLKDYENKQGICEEENDRLLNHLNSVRQKSDSLIEGYERKVQEYEKTIGEMNVYIESLERDKELYFTEGKKLLDDCTALQNKVNALSNERAHFYKESEDLKAQLNRGNSELSQANEKITKLTKERESLEEDFKTERKEWAGREQKLNNMISDFEHAIKQKNLEIESIKSYYNSKTDLPDIKDLQNRLDKECAEKNSLKREHESLLNEMKSIRESYSHLKRKLEVVEDDKRALKYKVQDYENIQEALKDGDRLKQELMNVRNKYAALKSRHEKYKEFTTESISNVFKAYNSQLDEVSNELIALSDKVYSISLPSTGGNIKEKVSEESKRFLTALNIPLNDLNGIVCGFTKVYEKMKNKIDILNDEVKVITKLNSSPVDNRVKEIIQRLAAEFKSAKADLESTKKYLEKKSKEIKEIKKEKESIQNKLSAIKERYEDLKYKDSRIKESYNSILNKLKMKDELISKLEMRMIH